MVMHTLMGVLNMHLIPSCEEGNLCAYSRLECDESGGKYTLDVLIIVFLLRCWFLRF